MKALIFREPWKLALDELEMPVADPGEVIVRVKAVGICGSDIHGYAAKTGRRAPGMVMGHEFCGIAQSGKYVGKKVAVQPIIVCRKCEYCRDGRQSICPSKRFIGVDMGTCGALAEFVAVPETNLFPMPDAMPFEHGALAEAFAVGAGAARNAKIINGDKVAVVGCGVIGLTAMLMAQTYSPAKIFMIDNKTERLQTAAGFGVETIDFSNKDPEQVVKTATGGAGADISIEAVGCSPSVATAVKIVKNGGRIVWVGNSQKIVEMDMQDIVVNAKNIVGMYCYNDDDFGKGMEFISDNPETAARFAEKKVSLEDAPEIFHQLANGDKQPLRAVVMM